MKWETVCPFVCLKGQKKGNIYNRRGLLKCRDRWKIDTIQILTPGNLKSYNQLYKFICRIYSIWNIQLCSRITKHSSTPNTDYEKAGSEPTAQNPKQSKTRNKRLQYETMKRWKGQSNCLQSLSIINSVLSRQQCSSFVLGRNKSLTKNNEVVPFIPLKYNLFLGYRKLGSSSSTIPSQQRCLIAVKRLLKILICNQLFSRLVD